MAQGDFTKEETAFIEKGITEMFEAIPRRKQSEYLGHLNDALVFLRAVKNNAPHEKTPPEDE